MIEIDEEFQNLIPPLTEDEFKQLEENCVREGIRDPLVVWDQGDKWILVDGHNRWNIAAHHGGIQFKTEKMHFKNREEAKIWIVKNQLGRRNLPAHVRVILALKVKPEIAEMAKEQKLSTLKQNTVNQKSDERKEINTAKEIAKLAGVSHDTVHKVEKIEAEATPQIKEMLNKGTISINQAYNSTFPKVLNPAKEAKKEHEEFREKAKEGMVDFTEAKKDKLNQEILYHDFLQNLYKPLNAVNGFGLMYQTKDLEKMADKIPEDLRTNLLFKIDHCMMVLDRVRKMLKRREE